MVGRLTLCQIRFRLSPHLKDPCGSQGRCLVVMEVRPETQPHLHCVSPCCGLEQYSQGGLFLNPFIDHVYIKQLKAAGNMGLSLYFFSFNICLSEARRTGFPAR